jgi:V/A-type H+-transporting ATPase subunit I
VAHLSLANLAQARVSRGWTRVGALGWAGVLVGAAAWGWLAMAAPATLAAQAPWTLLAQGLFAVSLLAVLLSALVPGEGLLGRLAALLSTVMRLPGALGDTLSYLRLFALGFAGASLASAFNDLAQQARGGVPGLGVLLAALVLLLGHGLNLVLGIAGAFVHGLRLNFIEFLNWSGVEEGRRFLPFHRKDQAPWTPPSP